VVSESAAAPFFFGLPTHPPTDQTFGWYDPPAGDIRRGGVLLCNPIGDDAVRAHRPLRHLAQRLSRAGFGVLRFDFRGTGDSAGDERCPLRVAAWLDDVRAALAELRARSGPGPIAVVGLRFGATLALLAGTGDEVDSVVLWGPFARGAAFHSETTRLYKMHRMLEPQSFSGGPRTRPDGEEAFGFLFTHETIAALKTLDVRALARAPARRALVLGDGTGAPAEQEIEAHLATLGVAVERRVIPQSRQFLIEVPHKSRLPEDAIDAMVGWLCEAPVTSTPELSSPLPPLSALASSEDLAENHGPGQGEGARGGEVCATEHPVFFGRRGTTFGILHEPAPSATPLPPIVLTSAGTVHRIGPHRLYVTLARQWAALGFPVLRIDLSGIGDTPAGHDGIENVTYPGHGYDDIQAAMRFLGDRLSASRFILAGLCSGGDFAFQMGLRDPRVVDALILNPRTFCVNDLAEVETGNFASVLAAAAGAQREAVPVPVSLRAMVERGVHTLLAVTEKDPGVHYVDTRWGEAMRALAELPGFHREDIPGADHNFTSLWSQERVAELCAEHLRRRTPR
jgi:alpha-beta hydrolase superfamily lysophospholipase